MFATLVTQLDDDDRAFMLDLYKNYYNLARKNIFNITHSKDDLEDLIDDVFVKLIEKVSLIRNFECCKLTTYIVYTIKSVSINHLRGKKHPASPSQNLCKPPLRCRMEAPKRRFTYGKKRSNHRTYQVNCTPEFIIPRVLSWKLRRHIPLQKFIKYTVCHKEYLGGIFP